jgi:hypothetical protein
MGAMLSYAQNEENKTRSMQTITPLATKERIMIFCMALPQLMRGGALP